MIGTTLTEAASNPELRLAVSQSLQRMDKVLCARITLGQERGEVDANANPAELARIASAMLYMLSIQARAGEPVKSLKTTINSAINAICGPKSE